MTQALVLKTGDLSVAPKQKTSAEVLAEIGIRYDPLQQRITIDDRCILMYPGVLEILEVFARHALAQRRQHDTTT